MKPEQVKKGGAVEVSVYSHVQEWESGITNSGKVVYRDPLGLGGCRVPMVHVDCGLAGSGWELLSNLRMAEVTS